ncbi:hypothetical protein ScPMuIL_010606 [Solemya velum]
MGCATSRDLNKVTLRGPRTNNDHDQLTVCGKTTCGRDVHSGKTIESEIEQRKLNGKPNQSDKKVKVHHVNSRETGCSDPPVKSFGAREEIIKDLESETTYQFTQKDEVMKELEEFGTHSHSRPGGVVFYVPINVDQQPSGTATKSPAVKTKKVLKDIPKPKLRPVVTTQEPDYKRKKQYDIDEKVLMADILREEAMYQRAKTAQQREERVKQAKVKRMERGNTDDNGEEEDSTELDRDIDSLDLRSGCGGNEEELGAVESGHQDVGAAVEQGIDQPRVNYAGRPLDTYYRGYAYEYDANDAYLDEQTPNEESILIVRPPSSYTMEELESALKESKFWVRENIYRLKQLAIGTEEYLQLRKRTMQDVRVYEQAKIEMVKRRRQMDRKRIPIEYQHYFITQSETDMKNIPEY